MGTPKPDVKLILCDANSAVMESLHEAFTGREAVELSHGYFEAVAERADCVVSPANSFGLMDGGFDAALTRHFGNQLQRRVQSAIIREWYGEQPVGTCMIVETAHDKPAWLAHAPTMRVPQSIVGTQNVYLAMRAVLVAVEQFNEPLHFLAHEERIKTILCPGLGTGAGGLTPAEAARQMRLAYDLVAAGRPSSLSWPYAIQLHEMAAPSDAPA